MKLSSITTIAFLLPAAAVIAWAGGRYLPLRTNVQEELKLSDGQKQELREKLPDYLQKIMKAPDARENLWAFLKETLNAEQLKRFRQLELQHEGPAALVGRPEIVKELKITDEEQKQIIAVIQDLQGKIEPLIKEAQSGGHPQEILPKVIKIREDYDGKIEAILSDAQKKKWKEMRGKPFDVFNDN